MLVESAGARPTIHPTAYVAPTAVISGDVTVGADSRVLFNAVLTAEGGPITIGERNVVMEGAVLRATAKSPLRTGHHVLVGPHAHLTGCDIGDEVFVATNASIFTGATIGSRATVAIGATVHIGCRLPAGTVVPIGWIASGDPFTLRTPNEIQDVFAGLDQMGGFLPYVFGIGQGLGRGEAMRKVLDGYTRALGRHLDDRVLSAATDAAPNPPGPPPESQRFTS